MITNFAGEFLILAGVFQQYWIWAVIGASGILLAAMYMLRLISAVLHVAVLVGLAVLVVWGVRTLFRDHSQA